MSTELQPDLANAPPPGYLGNLSREQQTKLSQFRVNLAQAKLLQEGDTIGTDDATLLRFLRARNFKLDASTAMWKNCVQWRRNCTDGQSLDELYTAIDPFNFPSKEEVFKYWPLASSASFSSTCD